MMSTVPLTIYEHVRDYFKRNEMDYDLQEIIPSKNPYDHYLFIVIAKKRNYPDYLKSMGFGPWTVWSTWNERTQSLNYGHYDILNYDKAYALAIDLRG